MSDLDGKKATSRPRHRGSFFKRDAASQPAVAQLLERRVLFSGANLVQNPNFAAYEPGSTTITASLAIGDYTNGLGSGLPVYAQGTADIVPYSDGTFGTKVDVPGWSASGSQGGVGAQGGVAYIDNVDNTTSQSGWISQTIAGSLQPNTTYSLSALISAPDGVNALNPSLSLVVGGAALSPTSASVPDVLPGQRSTWTESYSFGATPPPGAVVVTLSGGPDPSATAVEETFFTQISLTATLSAPASPTPTSPPASPSPVSEYDVVPIPINSDTSAIVGITAGGTAVISDQAQDVVDTFDVQHGLQRLPFSLDPGYYGVGAELASRPAVRFCLPSSPLRSLVSHS